MKKSDLQNAEERFQFYKLRRDELNALAREARDERDLINEERKKTKEELQKERDARDSVVALMKEHKMSKSKYREKIITLKRYMHDLKRNSNNTVESEYLGVTKEINKIERDLQIKPHQLQEENKLIDKLRELTRRKKELEKEIEKKKEVLGETEDLEAELANLQILEDREREVLNELYKQQQEHHKKVLELKEKLKYLTEMMNEKHKEYLKYREKADLYHKKAQEMLQKIIEIKGDYKRKKDMEKAILENLSEEAKKKTEIKDEDVEKFIEVLKKKKKISYP